MRSLISPLLIATVCCLSSVVSSFSEPQLPSIAELEKVNFSPDAKTNGNTLPYAEISDVKRLLAAFSATAKELVRYRDPLLTRGAPGEAIFRSASSSVVAVVVGSVDNEKNFNPKGLGTGAIVDTRGYILTNWHVVNGYRGAIIFLKPSGNAELTNAEAFGARLVYQEPTADLRSSR